MDTDGLRAVAASPEVVNELRDKRDNELDSGAGAEIALMFARSIV